MDSFINVEEKERSAQAFYWEVFFITPLGTVHKMRAQGYCVYFKSNI